jgi:hypothetical protein
LPVKAFLRSSRRGDGGFTLIELSMATFLCTIIFGAVVLIFNSVGQEARDTRRRADLQTQAREVITDLTAELRAAVPARSGAMAIESLTSNTLVFYTDRYGFTGPEKISYERSSCQSGYCILRVRRYAAVASSSPNWTYQTVPFADIVLLERVASTATLFAGVKWTGTPLTRTSVASCGGTTLCNFPMVAVDLKAAPPGVTTIDGPFGVYVEVTLRNA